MEKRKYETPVISVTYFSADSVLMISTFADKGFASFKDTWLGGGF